MADRRLEPTPGHRASVAAGEAARERVPPTALGDLDRAADRDPIGLVLGQDAARVPELVPIRHGRMSESPFAFYRGAALPMAADLARMPSPGLSAQLCGDAHLSNFGAYGSPERRLVFDINDFDETLPGPFEWDLKRLVASTALAGRANGFARDERERVARRTARAYRRAMAEFARRPVLEVWYARLDVEDRLAEIEHGAPKRMRKRIRAQMAKARSRDGLQALAKLTTVQDGQRVIRSDPPLVVPIEEWRTDLDPDELYAFLRGLVAGYARTLSADRRHLVEQFELARVAHKVVGVGSVGTRAWILLMESRDGGPPLLLQAKQAGRSVLAGYVADSVYDDQGERVVSGQRMMQATSDILLGWLRSQVPGGGPQDYYVRQLRDWKYGVNPAGLGPEEMVTYGRTCAWTLARAHARTGDRIAIATYLGETAEADHALARFAESYADLTERDHQAHLDAIAAGTILARVD